MLDIQRNKEEDLILLINEVIRIVIDLVKKKIYISYNDVW